MDGIELATWVLAFATAAYAAATIALYLETRGYARQTRDLVVQNRNLVEENRKERLRPIIDIILETKLHWTIEHLNNEINANRYDYQIPLHGTIFSMLNPQSYTNFDNVSHRLFMERLLEKHTAIVPLTKEHDELVAKLTESNEQLFTVLNTEEFNTSIQKALDKHYESTKLKIDYPPKNYAIDLVNYSDKTMTEFDSDPFIFYRANRDVFSNFLMRPEVQDKIRNRDEISSRLKAKAKELKEELQRLQEAIATEYLL